MYLRGIVSLLYMYNFMYMIVNLSVCVFVCYCVWYINVKLFEYCMCVFVCTHVPSFSHSTQTQTDDALRLRSRLSFCMLVFNRCNTRAATNRYTHIHTYIHTYIQVYLDYRLVDPDKVQAAREQYQEELFEILEEEKKHAEEERKLVEQQKWVETLEEANLNGVDTLLKTMLDEDPEQGKLQHLTFWMEVIDEIQHEFRCVCVVYVCTYLTHVCGCVYKK
jgi:hypothetical protein